MERKTVYQIITYTKRGTILTIATNSIDEAQKIIMNNFTGNYPGDVTKIEINKID